MRLALVSDAGAPAPAVVRASVRDSVRRAARMIGVGPGQVVLRFVDAAAMQELNVRWRGKDRPTDVLSFPAAPAAAPAPRHLGDIALCLPLATEQARRSRRPLEREAAVLAVHGLLHLLGYDHETDDGEMDALERRIRRALGLS
ncbi:MAG: rRNA maturation RNase YbeY [Acidobacteria bacterium]|nr:rRNA maturation RNase YbeY [Acidobacteriota bacterium]